MSQSPSPDTPAADADFFFPDFAPVPLLRRRRTGWTPDRQRLFIAMLAETGSVRKAARGVGLSARSAYRLTMPRRWKAAFRLATQQWNLR